MEKTKYRELKTQKQYLKMIAANCVNRFGDSIDSIAFSWLMYEVTGSPSMMAIIFGVNFLPTLILQPIFGALVEKLPKKKIMVIGDLGRAFMVGLCVLLLKLDMLTTTVLFVFTIINSTLEAFSIPAGVAFQPKIIDKEYYTLGTGLNQSLCRGIELIGLACAGGIIATLGNEGALLIDVVSFVLSALIVLTIKVKEEKDTTKVTAKSFKTDFKEGLGYIKSQKPLLCLLLAGALLNFTMVPINSFNAVYVSDFLKKGPDVLSYINILLLIGMAIGAFVTPKIQKISQHLLLSLGLFFEAIGNSCFYFALKFSTPQSQLIFLFSGVFIFGFFIGIVNVIFGSSFMKIVPQNLMGRMSGLVNAFLSSISPICAFLCSIVVSFFTVPQVVLFASILAGLFAVSTIFMKPLDKI